MEPIPRRTIPAANLECGAIGLGCMGMSWAYGESERDDERSISVIERAVEIGATMIDTADAYGPNTNEELVSRALAGSNLAGRREEITLATKGGLVQAATTWSETPALTISVRQSTAHCAASASSTSTSITCTGSTPTSRSKKLGRPRRGRQGRQDPRPRPLRGQHRRA